MRFFFPFIFALLICSCTNELNEQTAHYNHLISTQQVDTINSIPTLPSEISELTSSPNLKGDYIKYGVSFGECSGYCISEWIFEKSRKIFISKSWTDTLPIKRSEQKLTEDEWNDIVQSFDYKLFKKLPKKIGCPDCNDGGAGWFEISLSGKTHRVTFEFSSPPAELEKLIGTMDKHNIELR